MADDDDFDPVVHEVDVFLSKTSAEQLYLFQYPVRPVSHSYDQVSVVGAKIKPKQQKVELDLHVNTSTPNYSRSKGEQIALNVDGPSSGYDEASHFKSGVFDKQVVSSAPPLLDSSKYAIGVIKDGQFHLTPLKGIIQLKPDFTYLDKGDTRHKTKGGAADKMEGDSSQDEGEEEAKQVVVKFGRQETEEMKARRMRSYEYINRMRDEEPWVNLLYNGIHSRHSERERQRLFAGADRGVCQFQMTSVDYFKLLLPEAKEESSEKPALPTNVLSLSQLKTLSLSEQVRALLVNARAIRLTQLLALLPGNPDSISVLRYLQQVASLVQGCWVVKSEILYPKDTFSAHSGVSAEIICRGRDYIMWKFTQNRYVIRKDISSAIKLPAEEVKELLEQMSRMKANLGWEFLFEYDKDFVDRHTDIAQRQKMLWDARFQTLCTQLKLSKETEKKGRDQMGISQIPHRRRRPSSKSRLRTISGRSCSDMSDTDTEATSRNTPARRVEGMDVDATPPPKHRNRRKHLDMEVDRSSGTEPGESHTDDSCDNTVRGGDTRAQGDATENGSVVRFSSTVKNPGDGNHEAKSNGEIDQSELDRELREFAREHVKTKLVITQSELKRLFALKLMQCPPGHILGTGVSYHLIEAAIIKAGAVKMNNQKWPSDALKESVYVTMEMGDDKDEWRRVLVRLYESHHRIKLPTLKEQLEEALGTQVSETDCKNFLKDYSVARGSKWILKGTWVGNS